MNPEDFGFGFCLSFSLSLSSSSSFIFFSFFITSFFSFVSFFLEGVDGCVIGILFVWLEREVLDMRWEDGGEGGLIFNGIFSSSSFTVFWVFLRGMIRGADWNGSLCWGGLLAFEGEDEGWCESVEVFELFEGGLSILGFLVKGSIGGPPILKHEKFDLGNKSELSSLLLWLSNEVIFLIERIELH